MLFRSAIDEPRAFEVLDGFLGADGKPRSGADSSTVGWRASGVPGTVAGLALAVEKYGSGKVTWAQVCEPARRLAAQGHVVTAATAAELRQHAALLGQFPESKRVYLKGGAFFAAGEMPPLYQPGEGVQDFKVTADDLTHAGP